MATKSKSTTTSTNTPPGISRTVANRKRRLEKTLKAQPNNTQVQNALNDSGSTRRAPNSKQWSKTNIRLAKLYKEFGCRAPKELFSSNPKVQSSINPTNPNRLLKLPEGKVSFSLAARAHDKWGNLVWQ